MKVAFLVNDAHAVKPEQTTAMLLNESLHRGHDVVVCGVSDLMLSPEGQVVAQAWRRGHGRGGRVVLDTLDIVVVRTNPARDRRRAWAHDTELLLLGMLVRCGVLVTNHPDALLHCSNKLFLASLPEWTRPRMLVTQDKEVAREFLEMSDAPSVIKPLSGTRGRDVFLIRPGEADNLPQIVDVVTRQGYALLQEFVPAGEDGDTRVLVLEGRILRENGEAAAVHRIPPERDFRSNVHVGGTPSPAEITVGMEEAVEAIGPILMDRGLTLVGLDFVGDLIIEVNVFSPGGIRDAEKFTGERFCGPIVAAWERSRAS